jgi:zinc protease
MHSFKSLLLFCILLTASIAQAGPTIEHWQAPSGTRVYFVENHSLPMVDVQVDFAAGSALDPQGKSGLAATTHALLDLGTQSMDETQIANRLADLGAQITGGVDMDRASLGLRTLSAPDKRKPALDILRSVLTTPQFPPEVLEREKARSIVAIKESLTRPSTIAGNTFWSTMYPTHPYGRQASVESVGSLEQADLQGFYRANYTRQRAVVTIVGDVSRKQAETIAQQLTTDLPSGSSTSMPEAPDLPAASEQRIPHSAAQAHLMIGLPALKRGDPDFFPLIVGNYTLGGGGFVSRLMKEVRDKRGLAYGVQSYFMPMAQPGPFQIGLQTKKTQANEALQIVRQTLTRFLAEGPSEEELLAAKQNLVGSFPLRLDSNQKILENVALIGFFGLPLDYLDHYAENVEKVTAAEIKAAFAHHVRPENMVSVIVGSN